MKSSLFSAFVCNFLQVPLQTWLVSGSNLFSRIGSHPIIESDSNQMWFSEIWLRCNWHLVGSLRLVSIRLENLKWSNSDLKIQVGSNLFGRFAIWNKSELRIWPDLIWKSESAKKETSRAGSTQNSKLKDFVFLSSNSPFLKNPQVTLQFPPRF